MTTEMALKHLGLKAPVNHQQVRLAFASCVKRAHPDTVHYDPGVAPVDILQEARDTLLAVRDDTSLCPACSGTGKVKDPMMGTTRPCVVCDGTGET